MRPDWARFRGVWAQKWVCAQTIQTRQRDPMITTRAGDRASRSRCLPRSPAAIRIQSAAMPGDRGPEPNFARRIAEDDLRRIVISAHALRRLRAARPAGSSRRRGGRAGDGAPRRPRLGHPLRPRAGPAEPLPRLDSQARRARRPRPDRLRRLLDHRATALVTIGHAVRWLPAGRRDVRVPGRQERPRDRPHDLHQRRGYHLGHRAGSPLHDDAQALRRPHPGAAAATVAGRDRRPGVALTQPA